MLKIIKAWIGDYMWVLYLILAVAAFGFVYWAANEIITGREAKKELKAAYQELSDEVKMHNADIVMFTAQQQNDQTIGAKREDAITDLRNQLIDSRNKHPDVRLHNCATTNQASAVPDAAIKPDEKRTYGKREETGQPAGPNISAGLYEIAENADQCAIDKNAMIDWIHKECEIAKQNGRGCVEAQ